MMWPGVEIGLDRRWLSIGGTGISTSTVEVPLAVCGQEAGELAGRSGSSYFVIKINKVTRFGWCFQLDGDQVWYCSKLLGHFKVKI